MAFLKDEIVRIQNMASTSFLSEREAFNSPRRLESKQLPSVRSLGKGLSGFIYETTWLGNRYARKDFPLGPVKRCYVFEKEVKPLFDLHHPNIVKCIGFTVEKSSCSLVQEYLDDDLQNTMQRRIEVQRKKNSSSTLRSRVLNIDEIKRLLLCNAGEREIAGVDEGDSKSQGVGILLFLLKCLRR